MTAVAGRGNRRRAAAAAVVAVSTLLYGGRAPAQQPPGAGQPPPPAQNEAASAPPAALAAEDASAHLTLRASGGVAFLSSGYYCGYYSSYYVPSYACGAGYVVAQPDIDVDVDVWVTRTLGVSVGADVFWGSYQPSVTGVAPNRIYSTTWEPHLDLLLAPGSGTDQLKGRVRFGFGLYLAQMNGLNTTGQTLQYHQAGGVLRLSLGVSLLPHATVGLGLDAVLEAGWIGSNYVSTVQLLVGPELHF